MPRNISFFLTTSQVERQIKTVTRRMGWEFLKEGDILNACEKCQGLKKGEKVRKINEIKVISVRREPLSRIDQDECIREGFPAMTPDEFIDMFCKSHKGCTPQSIVTRIEFEYLIDYSALREYKEGEIPPNMKVGQRVKILTKTGQKFGRIAFLGKPLFQYHVETKDSFINIENWLMVRPVINTCSNVPVVFGGCTGI